MVKPTVVCLTPVRNESWILERFLRCASMWADHIIVADQASDDGSRDIAAAHPKVTVINNPSQSLDEAERQQILIEAARNLPGPRLLIALDADEVLSANVLVSPEWQTALNAAPGTVLRFQLAMLSPDLRSYWTTPFQLSFGFVDDGSPHEGRLIHSTRVPEPPGAPAITLEEVVVMHYVGVDPCRWESKHRWYQCWERVYRGLTPIKIYRYYHRKDVIPPSAWRPVPTSWFELYEAEGIDMASVPHEDIYRWDREVLSLLSTYGPDAFRRVAIWDVNWNTLYTKAFGRSPEIDLSDPRSPFEKGVHGCLKHTQHNFSYFSRRSVFRSATRLAERVLESAGW